MNLLPTEQQAEIRREYYARLLTMMFFGLSGVCIIGGLLLLPVFVSVVSDERALQSEISILEKEGASDGSFEREVDMLKKEIDMLASADGALISDIIILAVSYRGDVRITNIGFETGKDGIRTVSLGGIAPTRADLRAFAAALEREYQFSSIRVPVSNFVKERDIPFSLSIILRSPIDEGRPRGSGTTMP